LPSEPRAVQTRVAETVPAGTRLDSYIADTLGLFTRSQAKRRIRRLLVNGRPAKLSKRIQPGDLLELEYEQAPPTELLPEAIPLAILFEDENVLVVDKPQGLVVHPAAGNWSGTLVNALLHHSARLMERFPEENARPGIVHRLDKDTSGLIITAKSSESREFLARQFRLRRVGKQYIAIVRGGPPEERGRIESLLARDRRNRKRFRIVRPGGRGKKAVTFYRVLKRRGGHALLSLRPRTGRTHQLRVQLASLGCPIVGDALYGGLAAYGGKPAHGGRPAVSLLLHAYRLRILLPGESEPRTFRAPLPTRFKEFWSSLPADPG
jgi:23S rRNA pseudouridine1911/1915/1917 synthase